jgi:hypothetical protein
VLFSFSTSLGLSSYTLEKILMFFLKGSATSFLRSQMEHRTQDSLLIPRKEKAPGNEGEKMNLAPPHSRPKISLPTTGSSLLRGKKTQIAIKMKVF